MGSIRRVEKAGRVAGWQARWRTPEGEQRKRTLPRKVDAERFLVEIEASKSLGSYVDLGNRTTVAQWAAARPHRPSTARRVGFSIETHIAGTRLGERRLADVRPSKVQAWATDRAQVLSPSTLRQLVGLLRSIYASAVLDRLVGSSPVVRIALPRTATEPIVPLTVKQVTALAEQMPPRLRAAVITQAGLGLRLAELLALRVEDVDFLGRTVKVEHQIERDTGRRVEPKTPRSRRTVPLPAVVGQALSEHIRRFPQRGPGGELFTSSTGGVVPHGGYGGSRVFGAAVKRAGLPAGTSSHDLRHHYASVLLHAGESVVTVAARLGHENASLVLGTYGPVMPNSEERTRQAVDAAWSEAAAPRSRPGPAALGS